MPVNRPHSTLINISLFNLDVVLHSVPCFNSSLCTEDTDLCQENSLRPTHTHILSWLVQKVHNKTGPQYAHFCCSMLQKHRLRLCQNSNVMVPSVLLGTQGWTRSFQMAILSCIILTQKLAALLHSVPVESGPGRGQKRMCAWGRFWPTCPWLNEASSLPLSPRPAEQASAGFAFGPAAVCRHVLHPFTFVQNHATWCLLEQKVGALDRRFNYARQEPAAK